MKQLSERSVRRAIVRRPAVTALLRVEGIGVEAAARAAVTAARAEAGVPMHAAPSIVELGASPALSMAVEAIILEVGRPTLLITNGDFQPPEDEALAERLANARALLLPAIAAVGRIEVDDGFRRFPAGTGWLVGDGVLVTNRHVAELFVASGANSAPPELMKDFRGRDFEVHVDFLEEHGLPGEHEIRITKVLYIAERRGGVPDVAIFAIERSSALPRPIPLFNGTPAKGSWIGVIGYPLPDDRVPPENRDAEERYFSNIYGVKRLSPGTIRAPSDGGALSWLIAHDATTLGGNSGSAIVDLATGAAVGLHFAGRPQIENLGVGAAEIARLVKDAGAPATLVSVDRGDFDEPNIADIDTEAPRDALLAELATRKGYDATFIKPGSAAFTIPLPKITASAPGQIATPDQGGAELKYLHFSVKMNAERRLCYFSAVNIDGNKTFSIKGRRPGWKFDPRFDTPSSAQIKNECYGLEQDGKFSRGHMTRREDPNWGDDRVTAIEANDDTFFVTNACPQFQPFNAGIWLNLEDYALENADDDDMRIAVFTGPVFEASDPDYFGVKVPVRFWKIIAFKHDVTKKLTATGYIMSQEDALPTEEEFVFGQFRSSQVPITRIERLTGLDFHKLRDCDPLATEEETVVERPLRGPSDLVFRRPGDP